MTEMLLKLSWWQADVVEVPVLVLAVKLESSSANNTLSYLQNNSQLLGMPMNSTTKIIP